MNPFKYGQVVSNDDFCPRPKLIKEMKSYINSGQNFYLQGERRIGKTSLIIEATQKIKNKRLLYVDLLEIKTPDDLCKRLIKAIISLEQKDSFFNKMMKIFSHLKPTISYDPVTNLPTFSLDRNIILRPDSLEGVFDLISEINQTKALIVTMDEFQDILNLKEYKEILAILRGKIQFQGEISYIFSGSIRNKMHTIFNDLESPFFKSCISLPVGPIDPYKFTKYIREKFITGKRRIDQDTINLLFENAENISGDIQQLCEAIWEVTSFKDSIGKECIPKALKLIFSREIKGYELILGQITSHQLKCLLGLAKLGGKSVLSSEFIKNVGIIHASSIKKAFNRLEQLKIIYHIDSEYKFVNPFFKSWLISKNMLFD